MEIVRQAEDTRANLWPKRYTLLALCFVASFICYIDRVNISVAAISMQQTLHWSETVKGFVMSSFFIGYMLFQVPGGYLTDRFGGKIVLAGAVAWWSLATILTPLAASVSLSVLIACRIAMGLGEAVMFPAAYGLFSKWIPPVERSRAVSTLLSGVPIGTVFALSTTGLLVSAYGWESAFYVFGATGIVWLLVWMFTAHDSPEEHPTISARERALVLSTREPSGKSDIIPWREIFSSKAVWALIINHFCSNYAFYMLLAWLPSYFSKVHQFGLTQAGLFSAIPWVIMFLMINAAAFISDALISRNVSVTFVRKLMQTIGLGASAAFLLLVAGTSDSTMAFLFLCGALGLHGFVWSGFGPNHLDIAPRFAGVLMGISNTAGTLAGLVAVSVTGWLVDTSGTYSAAFVLVAAINAVGIIVWLLFGTGKKVIT